MHTRLTPKGILSKLKELSKSKRPFEQYDTFCKNNIQVSLFQSCMRH